MPWLQISSSTREFVLFALQSNVVTLLRQIPAHRCAIAAKVRARRAAAEATQSIDDFLQHLRFRRCSDVSVAFAFTRRHSYPSTSFCFTLCAASCLRRRAGTAKSACRPVPSFQGCSCFGRRHVPTSRSASSACKRAYFAVGAQVPRAAVMLVRTCARQGFGTSLKRKAERFQRRPW
jgi:hypothetical protein